MNKKGKILSPLLIQANENNKMNNKMNNIIEYIDYNIYTSIEDFFITYFFESSISMIDILERLSFTNENNSSNRILFKRKFLILLKSFNESET